MDGSHIDVDRHLPLRCHLINLGGCAVTYGNDSGRRIFSEPTLAVDDDDLYLRHPDGAPGETLIAGPLLSTLRTVREVERLADAVKRCPTIGRCWPCWTAPWPSGTCSGATTPATFADILIAERPQPALARLRAASTDRRPVAVAAYTSRPRTTEADGAVRLLLCDQGEAEIARVEVPDWLAEDSELLALSHAMLVKQCELGFGYPVAVSETHEQAVISGHDREEFRRITLILLEQRRLPTAESANVFSNRRPWV